MKNCDWSKEVLKLRGQLTALTTRIEKTLADKTANSQAIETARNKRGQLLADGQETLPVDAEISSLTATVEKCDDLELALKKSKSKVEAALIIADEEAGKQRRREIVEEQKRLFYNTAAQLSELVEKILPLMKHIEKYGDYSCVYGDSRLNLFLLVKVVCDRGFRAGIEKCLKTISPAGGEPG